MHTKSKSFNGGNLLVTTLTEGLSSKIHFLLLAAVSAINKEAMATLFWIGLFHCLVSWVWWPSYVCVSKISLPYPNPWCGLSGFFLFAGGVKVSPEEWECGLRRTFLNRFCNCFVHEPYTVYCTNKSRVHTHILLTHAWENTYMTISKGVTISFR